METPTSTVRLEFDAERNRLGDDKELRDSLSVAVHAGRNLFVASDETTTIERLTTDDGGQTFRHHATYALADFIKLPGKDDEEIDIEGLAADGGYLWLVGSHSRKRKKPKTDSPDVEKQIERLSTPRIETEGNRYTLARIPLARGQDGGDYELSKFKQDFGGARASLTAAQLPGRKDGNTLTDALRDDEHLGMFLPVPGKDNGFDIEGLAVAGNRVFLGLRGPVLRGWAVVLEIRVEQDDADASRLELKKLASGQPYRKHFLQLGGLGIRELCLHGQDLIVMAGPTMELDGITSVFLWPNALDANSNSLVSDKQLLKLFDLPFPILEDEENAGRDHAEGLTLFPSDNNPAALLIVYDAPAKRRRRGAGAVEADIFELTAEMLHDENQNGD
ncbi:MAG TPA: DUF3616 domain-containing protein [Pyrinomonadaceae bacterium]|jgi:hypothetical protein